MRLRYSVLSLLLVGLVLLGSLAQPVLAQLAANEVYVNQQFQVVGTHDGLNTTDYRLYRNGVQVASVAKAVALVGNVVTYPARSEPAVGTFIYELTAVNSDGTTTLESAKSAPFSLVVKPALTAPDTLTLPRIIRVTP